MEGVQMAMNVIYLSDMLWPQKGNEMHISFYLYRKSLNMGQSDSSEQCGHGTLTSIMKTW
jgi:hypothetical protein